MLKEASYLEVLINRFILFPFGKKVYKKFADTLKLNGNEQVLDFGCRAGSFAYFVAPKLPHGQLTCVDISKRMLNECRKKLKIYNNVSFIISTAENLPSDCYDVIYCHFMLHDIADSNLKIIISSLVKALKKNGQIIFKEPTDDFMKIHNIKMMFEEQKLTLKKSRITDVPLIGNTLENTYIK